jgi:hypothetical protein
MTELELKNELLKELYNCNTINAGWVDILNRLTNNSYL